MYAAKRAPKKSKMKSERNLMSDETQLGGTSVIAEPPVGIHRHPPTSFDHKEIHGLLTLSDLLDTYIGYRISTTNQKKHWTTNKRILPPTKV